MQSQNTHPSKTSVFNLAGLKAAGIGALGAFVGFIAASLVIPLFFSDTGRSQSSFSEVLLNQALIFGIEGLVVSALLLAYDNQASLRGRWERDLGRGLAIFAPLSFFSGGLGQLLYSNLGLTRGIPWMLIGAAIGAGVGLVRRDKIQAQRGALGGAIGGFTGGLLVDGFLAVSHTEHAFATASQLGIIITGAAIALMMRVVQDALKNAWLLGISTGPYEGKEYPLNTSRITVGRSELNDIALYREPALPPQLGAFVFQNDAWWWQGTPVTINGAFQAQAQLQPGDTIQLGATRFRYQTRSMKNPVASPAFSTAAPAVHTPGYGAPNYGAPGYGTPSYGAGGGLPNSPAATPPPTLPGPSFQGVSVPPPTMPAAGAGMIWVLQNALPSGHAIRLPPAPAQARLGRAAQNQVVLSDASVSSNHALLDVGANALSITDLGSTNGTKINGQAIPPNQRMPLQTNDRVTFGRLEYIVQNT